LSANESEKVRIFSLVDGDLEERLLSELEGEKGFDYRKAPLTRVPRRLEHIIKGAYWSSVCLDDIDVVLLPFTSSELEQLSGICRDKIITRDSGWGIWSWTAAAVIAVLQDDSLTDAVRAAQLDFDGILAEPFLKEQLPLIFERGRQRSLRRFRLGRRYKKMQGLFRKVNHDRRHLRKKVDLLCRDLVKSNSDLTNTLQSIRRAYDFQGELMGEYDLRYMLHLALRHIKQHLPDSNATIYLGHTGTMEAHISGPWYDEQRDLEELEEVFKNTIVPKLLGKGRCVVVADAGEWGEISQGQREQLAGLSVMGLPVILEDELLGVLVLYREREMAFEDKDRIQIEPYLKPLGRAVAAVQKLQQILKA